MHKSKIWFNETEIPNVFLEPEPIFKSWIDNQTSYGKMFEKALSSTKTILEYGYGIKENEKLANRRFDTHFYQNFEIIFTEMLKRCGIYLRRNNRSGRYEVVGYPVDINDLRILFDFKYDKKSQTLTEQIGGGLFEDEKKNISFSQQEVKEFFDSFFTDENQVECSER